MPFAFITWCSHKHTNYQTVNPILDTQVSNYVKCVSFLYRLYKFPVLKSTAYEGFIHILTLTRHFNVNVSMLNSNSLISETNCSRREGLYRFPAKKGQCIMTGCNSCENNSLLHVANFKNTVSLILARCTWLPIRDWFIVNIKQFGSFI